MSDPQRAQSAQKESLALIIELLGAIETFLELSFAESSPREKKIAGFV
jgi:hypothetical protein